MNPYEELAGYRFASGRDYDKRAVETFRARVLNLVDDLLNQVTQLQDEVADLRDRCRTASIDPAPAVPVPPVVPTSWLEALAGAPDAVEPTSADPVSAPLLSAFPAPALGNWLADLEAPVGAFDDDLDDDEIGAGSTAELLLAAAGNAVAVQAAALATLHGDTIAPAPVPPPTFEAAPPTTPPPLFAREPPEDVPPAISFEPSRGFEPVIASIRPDRAVAAGANADADEVAHTAIVGGITGGPIPTFTPAPIDLEPFSPDLDGRRTMNVVPGDSVVAEPPPITELSRLPIVLDDGLPADEPLPAPIRHWGGWMRDAAPLR